MKMQPEMHLRAKILSYRLFDGTKDSNDISIKLDVLAFFDRIMRRGTQMQVLLSMKSFDYSCSSGK